MKASRTKTMICMFVQTDSLCLGFLNPLTKILEEHNLHNLHNEDIVPEAHVQSFKRAPTQILAPFRSHRFHHKPSFKLLVSFLSTTTSCLCERYLAGSRIEFTKHIQDLEV
jgi:hypothetical protein